MRRLRPLVGAMAITAAGFFGSLPTPTLAQSDQPAPRIIQSIQTADAPMPADGLQAINAFNDYWVMQLASGDEAQIAKARKELKQIVSPSGSSKEFVKQFNHNLLAKLAQVIQKPNIPSDSSADEKAQIENNFLLTRINAMIVLVNTEGAGIEPVLAIGLNDENPGVRYWASKAVSKIAQYKRLTKEEQAPVLKLLEQALGRETQSAALTEQLAALSNMNVGTARGILLNVLTARVGVHAKDIYASYSPEQKALQEMFTKLIADIARNGIDSDQIKSFTSVAFRYMTLATDQLLTDTAFTNETIADKRTIIRLGDRIMRFAHENIDPGARSPEKIDNALSLGDWAFIKTKVNDWNKILTKSPFNIPEDELQTK
ncbi:hypothetical protein KS4_36050 [Poriferisphaera corsica]|uniref:HEAT repeat domain-containing protein n=1 Tax=Poriferisphaera corsica TaxID=2528020 RepID=A0A517YZ71_9BACT|nr:hypothetical protein [Poriferisphaera corsica]QDU35522.1 hypothetical protein KS4_36050 [Poriferisphaera corsica]